MNCVFSLFHSGCWPAQLIAFVFHNYPDNSCSNFFCNVVTSLVSDLKFFLQCRHISGFSFEIVHNRYIHNQEEYFPATSNTFSLCRYCWL